MIFDIAQTKNGLSMSWIALGENILAEIEAPCMQGRFQVYIHGKEYTQELLFAPGELPAGVDLEKRSTWRIYENNVEVGTISQKSKNVKGLFQSYVYDEYVYRDEIYHCYEVGLGNKGIYMCVYHGNNLVAMVDKRLKVTNYLDQYRCYLMREEDWKMLLPYVIRYDALKYGNMFERSVHSRQHHKLNTIQKEVLSKYDPTFIERVKAQGSFK